MVSVDAIITDAALPMSESVPKALKISDAIAREPLPETGLKRAKGKSSDGKWIKSHKGDIRRDIKSTNPDALKTLIAIKRAKSEGKTDQTDLTPFTIPSVNS